MIAQEEKPPVTESPDQRFPVSIYPTKHCVEVAPGERYVDLPPSTVPKAGIVRWVPAGDGTYRPRLQIMETWVRVGNCEQFGIHIKRDTLIRLGSAGFIEISQPSPFTPSITVESLLAHIEAAKDPEFWTEERLERYRKTMMAATFRITPEPTEKRPPAGSAGETAKKPK